jgi:hypothetical protein
MKLFRTLMIYLFPLILSAQEVTKEKRYSFVGGAGVLFIANSSFDNLNEMISKSGTVDPPYPGFASISVGQLFEKGKFGTEIDLVTFYGANKFSPQNNLTFKVNGLSIKLLFRNRFFDRKRFDMAYYFGFGYTFLDFRLLDKYENLTPIDSLLVSPSKAVALNFKPKGLIFNLDAGFDIEFKTRLFRSFLNDFNIGLRLGYSQPVFASKDIIYAGSSNAIVPNFPKMSYNNVIFQLLFKITFKESPVVKKVDK